MRETRDTLSDRVSAASGFSRQRCREVLDSLLVEIICRSRDEGFVDVFGLGTFEVVTLYKRPYNIRERKLMPAQEKARLKFYPDRKFLRKFLRTVKE